VPKRKDDNTLILATMKSCRTDPTQYKPYAPEFDISNAYQEVLVEMQIPADQLLEVSEVGTGKKKKKVIITTVKGVTMMMKLVASQMLGAVSAYDPSKIKG
jgi:hypothetical protein